MNGCPGKIPTCERLSLNPFLFWKVKKAKGKQGQMTSHIPEHSQVPGRAGLTFFFPSSKSHLATRSRSVSRDMFVPVQGASSPSSSSVWSKRQGSSGVHQRN